MKCYGTDSYSITHLHKGGKYYEEKNNSLYISFAGSNLMYYNDKYFNTSMFGKGNIEAADRLAEIVRNYD